MLLTSTGDPVPTGRVVGRWVHAREQADGTPVPASGTVMFSPQVDRVQYPSASPDPMTLTPAPVECSLDPDGYLVDPDGGAPGVLLLATDDADGEPTGWKYLVRLRLDGGPMRAYSISVPSGSEVDLTTAAPTVST